jgi:hypothetical protein
MTRIASKDVEFHPHSFADPLGRLFTWNGNLYRGISPEWEPHFRSVLENPVVARLMNQRRIVETEPTDLASDDYGLIVRQRRIPFVSYPHEWPLLMFRDACRLMIDLCIELSAARYTLKDGHPWNVLFDSCNPVFVDVGSIAPHHEPGTWPAYDEFCRFCLFPLLVMNAGQERIARALLPTYEGITRDDVSLLTRDKTSIDKNRLSRLARRLLRQWSGGNVFRELRAEIDQIRAPSSIPLAETASSPAVTGFMLDVLTEGNTQTVLVLRDRALAIMAARTKRQVVALHLDSVGAMQLYEQATAENLTILPLMLDFTIPTPSTGLSSHWLIAASDRLKCDVVLAPGLVEELVFKRHLRFEQICHGLGAFCRRVAVVDFTLAGPGGTRPGWYTVEGLGQSLNKYFHRVRVQATETSNRVVMVCEDSRIAHA